jgi:AcrR family transcriptional regulator
VAPQPRTPLSRGRVLRVAVGLADAEGLPALTMRRLAQELGVEAMSLYHYVANKEALLDGVLEVVMAEVDAALADPGGPSPAEDWQAAMRARILATRAVLLEHPWAPRVIETRTGISPAMIGYYDGLLGVFRAGGFSYDLAHHAMHALGSRALGFTRELFEPEDPQAGEDEAMAMLEQMAEQYPHIVAMVADAVDHQPENTLGWCDDQVEFEFGLDLILDGLDRLRSRG